MTEILKKYRDLFVKSKFNFVHVDCSQNFTCNQTTHSIGVRCMCRNESCNGSHSGLVNYCSGK